MTKLKSIALISVIGIIAGLGFIDPYSRRLRPFTSVPSSCAENEIGYSMTLHKGYICTNAGYKPIDLSGATTYAPIAAKYIVQTADSDLTAEQALGALATGILKNTTTTGVLSIAAAGTDYQIPATTIAGYGITDFNSLGDARWQLLSGKDATGGYTGLTLFKIDFKNAANTFTSFLTNSNTAARTYTFQDRDGTIADDTDLALKANLASPTFTGTFTSNTVNIFGTTASDQATTVLIRGISKAMRIGTTATLSALEGVDQTGAGSYQPISVGGADVRFTISGAEKWRVDTGGNFITGTDNAVDIGASGATRPRSIYIGTNGTFGGNNSAATYSTATNCSDSAGAAACGSAAAGSFVIDATTTSTVVSTTAVTANSQIIVQEDSSLGTRLGVTCNTQSSLTLGALRVTARTAGTSFTVTIEAGPTTNPMCVNYTIIN